jgi:hypothetical protein
MLAGGRRPCSFSAAGSPAEASSPACARRTTSGYVGRSSPSRRRQLRSARPPSPPRCTFLLAPRPSSPHVDVDELEWIRRQSPSLAPVPPSSRGCIAPQLGPPQSRVGRYVGRRRNSTRACPSSSRKPEDRSWRPCLLLAGGTMAAKLLGARWPGLPQPRLKQVHRRSIGAESHVGRFLLSPPPIRRQLHSRAKRRARTWWDPQSTWMRAVESRQL